MEQDICDHLKEVMGKIHGERSDAEVTGALEKAHEAIVALRVRLGIQHVESSLGQAPEPASPLEMPPELEPAPPPPEPKHEPLHMHEHKPKHEHKHKK